MCLLGEAYGEVEARLDTPFKGPAGFRLERMVQQLGARREDFLITNCAWFRPPGNREPTEVEVESYRERWEGAIRQAGCKVVVPLGNIPMRAVLGHWGVQGRRGYLEWSARLDCWVLPTVHPSFIMRGNANWTAAWLRDVEMALQVAQDGPPAMPVRELLLDPPLGDLHALESSLDLRVRFDAAQDVSGNLRGPDPQKCGAENGGWGQDGLSATAADIGGHPPRTAVEWGHAWIRAGRPPLAVDIETPDKGDDEEEAELSAGTAAGTIYRVGLAYCHDTHTSVVSMAWGGAFTDLARDLLQQAHTALVWNRHFDVPRLRAHGVTAPFWHDAQEMWHVFHPDLPKKLEFVAPFLVPAQQYWKDKSHSHPALYNAIDAALTAEGYEVLYGTAA